MIAEVPSGYLQQIPPPKECKHRIWVEGICLQFSRLQKQLKSKQGGLENSRESKKKQTLRESRERKFLGQSSGWKDIPGIVCRETASCCLFHLSSGKH